MRIDAIRVHCACGEVFDPEVVIEAPVDVCVASMRAIYCPECGGKEIFMGGEHKDVPAPESPINVRAYWWRRRGAVGTSSMTIFAALTQQDEPREGTSYPLDADDFSRCYRLLEIVPEWRPRIGEVATRFPWFKPFADRWDVLSRMYEGERESRKFSQLGAMLTRAAKEADAIRSAK